MIFKFQNVKGINHTLDTDFLQAGYALMSSLDLAGMRDLHAKRLHGASNYPAGFSTQTNQRLSCVKLLLIDAELQKRGLA